MARGRDAAVRVLFCEFSQASGALALQIFVFFSRNSRLIALCYVLDGKARS